MNHERPGKTWTILSADYVTSDSGTGLVHQAPGFGEDDYQTCAKNGIIDKDGTDMNLPVSGDTPIARLGKPVLETALLDMTWHPSRLLIISQ
mmetsp:Transcript_20141/g.16844  ORF Transcript_20141/g.16844 Transcript_20141/m.16844 type:complete len:92 (+) Transcript_20141:300-575(+)